MPIKNGSDIPMNQTGGNLPQVQGAMQTWFRPMTFMIVAKVIKNYLVKETGTVVDFLGVWQVLSAQKLMMKPEGQRQWKWFMVHAETSLILDPDMVITYNGTQYRVESKRDYKEYGYVEYHLYQDYTGVGPTVVTP